MKKKCTKYWIYIAVMLGLIALLNLIACSAAFCGWYVERVYPHLAEALGRLTAPLPFSLAEVLNVIEVLGVFTAIAALILLPFLRKKQGCRRFCKGIWKTVLAAGDNFSPALIANYCYDLAKQFNHFYQDTPIFKEEDAAKRLLRLKLSRWVSLVLRSGMALLGIEVPEKM